MQQRGHQARRTRPANLSATARGHRNGGAREKVRQKYESYLARAREAQSMGDIVEMENCYQHADHYRRLMSGVDVGT